MKYLEITQEEPSNSEGSTIIFAKIGVPEQTSPTSEVATKKLSEILKMCNGCPAACGGASIVRWIMNDAIIAQGEEPDTFKQGGAARCTQP